jgi:flagellar assembly protein FliH
MPPRVRPIALPVKHRSAAPPWLAALGAESIVRPAFVGEEAQAEADRARADLERDEALARAVAEGRARGEAEGREAMAQAAARLDALLADLEGARRRLMARAERELVELALVIAGAVLEREIEAEPDYLLRLVRQVVEMVADGDQVEIAVSPRDLELVLAHKDELARESPRAGALLVRADEAIAAGCVVETRLARVDATLATRLRNVAAELQAEERER